jgi:hypothetical protein
MLRLHTLPTLLLFGALSACTQATDQPKQPAAPSVGETVADSAAMPPTTLQTAAYAGEYNWGDTTREQAGGTLLVYPESDSTVLLALDVSNGPPAFHLGQLYRRAVVHRGMGQCAFKENYDSLGCRLRLTFASEKVVVTTERGYAECGFGQGVSADETYRRTSSVVPQQFMNGEGRKIRFKTITPEQYNSTGL